MEGGTENGAGAEPTSVVAANSETPYNSHPSER